MGTRSQMQTEILIRPDERRVRAGSDETILSLLQREDYPVISECGGVGTCRKCRVRILDGIPDPTVADHKTLNERELESGVRLSCMHQVTDGMVIEAPSVDQSAVAKQLMSKGVQGVAIDSGVKKFYREFPKPHIEDQRPDTLRIQEELGLGEELEFSLPALQKVTEVLHRNDFKATVTVAGGRVLDVEPEDTSADSYGVAFDIGTTTIAGYLLNLNTGEELGVRSGMNPQRSYGADVIARIKHVHDHGDKGLRKLRGKVLSAVNSIIQKLCDETGITPGNIYQATFAGNPTMTHLFIGADPSYIDHSPYIPATRDRNEFTGVELGVKMNPAGRVLILPNVSGYVGGDITAGMLATDLHHAEGLMLLVDIGTNCEITLGNRERIVSCSSPAGPALEGAKIEQGMTAHPGAISHVVIDPDAVHLETIDDAKPIGICGTGLVDIVGQLWKVEMLAKQGHFQPRPDLPIGKRLVEVEVDREGRPGERIKMKRFILTDGEHPVYLSQKDVRELQVAKGAIRSGVEIVMKEWGVTPDQIDQVFLAGAFGSFLRAENVVRTGMLPNFPLEKINAVGNAAGQGAKICLVNRDKWDEVQEIVERVDYLELSARSDFGDVFMVSMFFTEKNLLEDEDL
ncbi:MAG: ASKHA domain-containing protein [Candidatus Bipolaricaulia bacterium]